MARAEEHIALSAGFTGEANQLSEKQMFFDAYDALCADLNFESPEHSITPKNAQKAEDAYRTFANSMKEKCGWEFTDFAFKDLFKEKEGTFRNDGDTPNWYHELRQNLNFLAMVRADIIDYDVLNEHGSADVISASIWSHDSHEDTAKKLHYFFNPLSKKQYGEAAVYTNNIEYLSRKRNGDDIYPNDNLNLYYIRLRKHPIAALLKMGDTIDGGTTRLIPKRFVNGNKFSYQRNQAYVEKRRDVFAGAAQELSLKAPALANALTLYEAMMLQSFNNLEMLNAKFDRDVKTTFGQTQPLEDAYTAALYAKFKEHMPPAFNMLNVQKSRFVEAAQTIPEAEYVFDKEAYFPPNAANDQQISDDMEQHIA